LTAVGLVFGSKEDRGSKDAMEALDYAAIMTAVLGEAEKVEHLGGALETYDPAFLLHSQRCYPDGYEAVLAKGEAEFGMAGDIEKEPPVAPRVNKPQPGRPAERNAAENEWPGIVGKLLFAVLSFLPNESDGFQLAKSEFCDAKR
jgi:hypothetical protein